MDQKSQKELTFTIPRKRPYKRVYQFKILLLETKPPVWRRILVPESYTFFDLHVAIQDAMEWTDSHLHRFETKPMYDPKSITIECPYDDPYEERENILHDTEVSLTDFFREKNDKMFYIYDFGDNWAHEVILEEIFAKDQKIKYPICISGKLACPPEDCGSIPGYYDCIKTYSDKKDKELLEWLGDWDPLYFEPKDIIFRDPKKSLIESWSQH